jgi:hypothetical protein
MREKGIDDCVEDVRDENRMGDEFFVGQSVRFFWIVERTF